MSANISKATKKPAKSGRTLAALLIVLVAFGALAIIQGDTKLKLGLDLRGGTSVTLAPKVSNGGKVDKSAVDQAVAIIRQRVNSLGVAESEVSSQSNGDIIVSVPGNSSSRVVDLVGATAQLRFRQVLAVGSGNATTSASASATTTTTKAGKKVTSAPAPTFPSGVNAALDSAFKNLNCTIPANRQGGAIDDPAAPLVSCSRDGTAKYILAPAEVEGNQVSKASAVLDNTNGNGWMVLLSFNGAGTTAFGHMTTRVTTLGSPQNQAAIVLDGLVVSAPRINEAINSGSAQITGNFTQTDATDLANKLKYGALPLALTVQEINQVSPTLGSDQLHAGLLAGLIGLILVVIYSLLYYRGLGLVSVGSLVVAGTITYLSFLLLAKWIGFTLTLAGIAGAIVSIGITADSFIVYFERLRDEVREGRSLRTAVETGWRRARRTILVADFVSLIAAALLYFFAVGGVRGFAFTLGLTTFVDLIVVFFFTKPFVTILSRVAFYAHGSSLRPFGQELGRCYRNRKGIALMTLSGIGGRLYRGETSINFIAKKKRWFAFSGLLIIISAIALGTQGLKLGIEFKGGSVFTVQAPNVTIADGNSALKSGGVTTESIIQKIGSNKLRIQTTDLPQSTISAARSALATTFKIDPANIDVQTVGPSWGKEITHKAIYGLIGFLLVVMLYLAMAFEPKMALSAIIAVIHDVFITVGIYALVGFEVTPATVIGFLTILGYSLYDTVVVFDKVRENTKGITSTAKQTYSQASNLALNQTLVRSFNTSLIALLPVASILFVGAGLLGAGTLKDLSLALFIGLATGTYSSIFVATPLLATLREREPAMQALAKRVAVRGGSPEPLVDKNTAGVITSTHSKDSHERGPRNQPKRKPRRR